MIDNVQSNLLFLSLYLFIPLFPLAKGSFLIKNSIVCDRPDGLGM